MEMDFRSVLKDPVMCVATGFGSGLLPAVPGTWGSVAAIPFCLLLSLVPASFQIFVFTILVLFGVGICQKAEERLGSKDPGCVVFDEFMGMAVTLAGIPLSFGTVLAGFILFRIFDIAKPWPVKVFDKSYPGGAGIMLDDLAAGVYARIVLGIGLVLVGA